MHSNVVLHESVRLALLVAALNDVDIRTANIQNAFLEAIMKEKMYIVVGKKYE